MEFTFSLPGLQAEGVTCWDRVQTGKLDVQSRERLRLVIDTFGKNSAQSQGLSASITDMFRLQTTNHKLYLVTTQESGRLIVLGGIKSGRKKLFIRVETGSFQEIEPVCVLDFYVHESQQRQGIGRCLFEHFLAAEGQTAASVGYDRPSHKFLQFIRKHYGLAQYIPQSNNFVVFSSYFHNAASPDPAGSIWTSVSQRPLTAQKRLRTTSAHSTQSLMQQQASMVPAQRRHPAAQPGIPVFRSTSGNKQLLQQQSAAGALQTSRSDQASHSPQGFVQPCREPVGSGDMIQQQYSTDKPQHLSRKVRTPQTAAEQQGLFQSSRRAGCGSTQQQSMVLRETYGRQQQTSAQLASAVMYVKPPWAIDDSFQDPLKQATFPGPQKVSYINSPSQYKQATPAAYSNTSERLAGRQRSGSGAKGCMTW